MSEFRALIYEDLMKDYFGDTPESEADCYPFNHIVIMAIAPIDIGREGRAPVLS
jgi:hypothetical protein